MTLLGTSDSLDSPINTTYETPGEDSSRSASPIEKKIGELSLKISTSQSLSDIGSPRSSAFDSFPSTPISTASFQSNPNSPQTFSSFSSSPNSLLSLKSSTGSLSLSPASTDPSPLLSGSSSSSPSDTDYLAIGDLLFSKKVISENDLSKCFEANKRVKENRQRIWNGSKDALKVKPDQQEILNEITNLSEKLKMKNFFERENLSDFIFTSVKNCSKKMLRPDIASDKILLNDFFHQFYERSGFSEMMLMYYTALEQNIGFAYDQNTVELFARSLLKSPDNKFVMAEQIPIQNFYDTIIENADEDLKNGVLVQRIMNGHYNSVLSASQVMGLNGEECLERITNLCFYESDLGKTKADLAVKIMSDSIDRLTLNERTTIYKAHLAEKEAITGKSLLKTSASEDNISDDQYDVLLENASDCFAKAFALNPKPEYAKRILHIIITRTKQFDEAALEMSYNLFISSLQNGGMESSRLNVKLSLLESAILLSDEIDMVDDNYISNILQSIANHDLTQHDSSNLDDTISQLMFMKMLLNDDGQLFIDDSKKEGLLSTLIYVIQTLEHIKSGRPVAIATCNNEQWNPPIFKKSFTYRGLTSNYIEGNFEFGGQLNSHCINRSDIEKFEELITTPLNRYANLDDAKLVAIRNKWLSQNPQAHEEDFNNLSLSQIDDVRLFMSIVDIKIRNAFGTEKHNLEDLHSEGHKKFDDKTQSLIKFAGMDNWEDRKEIKDSRTSLSAALALGLGDCRHHAQAKQLLFDVWQSYKINNILKEPISPEIMLEKAKKVFKYELRTFDVEVHAPVKMHKIYNPVLMERNGKLYHVLSDPKTITTENKVIVIEAKDHTIEDHTMNFLVERDDLGCFLEMEFADSFYQQHYEFGEGAASIMELPSPEGKQVSQIYANELEAINPKTGKIVKLPITLIPTFYAGKRDKYLPEGNQQLVLGMPLSVNAFGPNTMIKGQNKDHNHALSYIAGKMVLPN
jgi:hypothetical protein